MGLSLLLLRVMWNKRTATEVIWTHLPQLGRVKFKTISEDEIRRKILNKNVGENQRDGEIEMTTSQNLAESELRSTFTNSLGS